MKRCVLGLILSLAVQFCFAGEPPGKKVLDLAGTWLFRPGDDVRWARSDLNDRNWDQIEVPSPWENVGYPGLDGYGWYRKHFNLGLRGSRRPLILWLGRVDDADAVYVNGHFVGGMGGFGPEFQTSMAWAWRSYRIPAEFLNPKGGNVIAIRVFDREMAGGIVEGTVSLHEEADPLPLAVDLAGKWQVRKGDQMFWRFIRPKDLGWRDITVPGAWEHQGMEMYDGYAWYRRIFYVSPKISNERLVLLLGTIDDLDETFINGVRVGGTGAIDTRRIGGEEYRKQRVYPIPQDLLQPGKFNVIAVRVYDGRVWGGILTGPIGIIRRADIARDSPWWDRFRVER